jgi:hypothetical protein
MEGHTRINQICTSWLSCLWKLCELVSNVEEQPSIVFMYTGTPISSPVIKKCVHLKCFCFVYDVWTTDLGFCQVSELLASFRKWTCFFTWGKAWGVPDDLYCTLENDVIHVHWSWYYNFLLSLFQLRRIEMVTDLRISYWNNFYFVLILPY